jgi:hypothetical protein
MTKLASRRSLHSRWLALAAMVMGLTVASLAAPSAARADRDDWHGHRHYRGHVWVGPRYYAGWRAPVFVAPPPPVYVVPAVPRYVVVPPPPPLLVVPPLPRIVLPIGRHGAVIFP